MRSIFLTVILMFISSNGFANPLSVEELMRIADQEVVSLGEDPTEMTAYIDLFSFEGDLVEKQETWKIIRTRMRRQELWEIHYMPKARVFDGEIFVLIDKKTGKVFATFDMKNGTILK